jgi:uncharacterized membrane protein
MASPIKDSVSKVKNNPIMAIAGGIATYYLLKKKMPTSKMATNPYFLVGSVVLGAVLTAYATSYVKQKTSTQTIY